MWALQKAGKLRREEMTLKRGGLVVTSKLVLTIYLADDLLSYTTESSGLYDGINTQILSVLMM